MNILAGKSSIRELVKQENDTGAVLESVQVTHKTEAMKTENTKKSDKTTALPRVLDSHIERALDRNNAEDIFLHIMRKTD